MKWKQLLCCCLLLCVGSGCGHMAAAPVDEAPASAQEEAAVDCRVACVGDSLTAGFGARSYVAYLSEQPGVVAENFGVCGTTVCDGAAAYTHTPAYEDSLDMAADSVVLMLGTNDSVQWNGKMAFYEALSDLVDTYTEETDQVLICTPLAPTEDNDFNIDRATFEDICVVIQAVAEEKQLPLLDFYDRTCTMNQYTIGDGIHPSEETSAWMAEQVYQQLCDLGWVKNTALEDIK